MDEGLNVGEADAEAEHVDIREFDDEDDADRFFEETAAALKDGPRGNAAS